MDIETFFTDNYREFLSHDNPLNRPLAPSASLAATGDFERLLSMAEPLVREYDDICSPEWEASPIGWIRQVSSAHRRGKVGEQLVRSWAVDEGLAVGGRGHRGHDVIVAGLKLEVKTSLRWNNHRFVFLGLRDFDYDAVALLGLEPNDFALWIVPKQLLWERARDQLRGVSGQGSKWLSFPAGQPPAWLRPWGGSFAEAAAALHRVTSYEPERDAELDQHEAWLELSSDIDWPWQPGDQGVTHDALRRDEPREMAHYPSHFVSVAPSAHPLIGAAHAEEQRQPTSHNPTKRSNSCHPPTSTA
jgi:hypothetical protein